MASARRAPDERHPRAVEDQQQADSHLERLDLDMAQQRRADRHADQAGNEERPQPRPDQAFPDPGQRLHVAAHRAERDEGSGRRRRHGVQPEAQRHQTVAGAAQTVDEACGRCPGDDDRDVAERR
jgi:hypothetical protein